MARNTIDAKRTNRALSLIDQAECLADAIPSVAELDGPSAAARVARQARVRLDKAFHVVCRLSCYCTGSCVDQSLRQRLYAIRGRI